MISFSGLILYLNHGEDGGLHIRNMSLLLEVNWEHLQCVFCMVQSLDLICKMEKPGLCHGGGGGYLSRICRYYSWLIGSIGVLILVRFLLRLGHTHTHIYI